MQNVGEPTTPPDTPRPGRIHPRLNRSIDGYLHSIKITFIASLEPSGIECLVPVIRNCHSGTITELLIEPALANRILLRIPLHQCKGSFPHPIYIPHDAIVGTAYGIPTKSPPKFANLEAIQVLKSDIELMRKAWKKRSAKGRNVTHLLLNKELAQKEQAKRRRSHLAEGKIQNSEEPCHTPESNEDTDNSDSLKPNLAEGKILPAEQSTPPSPPCHSSEETPTPRRAGLRKRKPRHTPKPNDSSEDTDTSDSSTTSPSPTEKPKKITHSFNSSSNDDDNWPPLPTQTKKKRKKDKYPQKQSTHHPPSDKQTKKRKSIQKPTDLEKTSIKKFFSAKPLPPPPPPSLPPPPPLTGIKRHFTAIDTAPPLTDTTPTPQPHLKRPRLITLKKTRKPVTLPPRKPPKPPKDPDKQNDTKPDNTFPPKPPEDPDPSTNSSIRIPHT
jgi:hypothetical protein